MKADNHHKYAHMLSPHGVQLWNEIIRDTLPDGILNISIQSVAHKLSAMLGHPILVGDLCVEQIPPGHLQTSWCDPEAEVVGIYLIIEGDVSGEAVLVLCSDDAMCLADWLLETDPGTTTQLDEMEYSALSEFGNLALSAFLNSAADIIGLPLRLSPPTVVVDMVAVIFEAVAMSAVTDSDELLIIKANFVNKTNSVEFQLWILPDCAGEAMSPNVP